MTRVMIYPWPAEEKKIGHGFWRAADALARSREIRINTTQLLYVNARVLNPMVYVYEICRECEVFDFRSLEFIAMVFDRSL